MNKIQTNIMSKVKVTKNEMKTMKEVFKSIPDYEGMYEVSNLGRVKSFKMNKETILKSPVDKVGYELVGLSKDGISKSYKVHKLVAMAFLNHIPNGYVSVVNHIDLDKTNNRVDNLEVVSARENSNRKHMNSSSQYTGVVWVKNNQKWKSQIRISGQVISLGHYDDEILSSNAYQLALINKELFDGDKKAFRKGIKTILENKFYHNVEVISA